MTVTSPCDSTVTWSNRQFSKWQADGRSQYNWMFTVMLFIKTLLTFNKSKLTFKQRIVNSYHNFSEALKECELLHWIPRKFRDPLICKFLPPPLWRCKNHVLQCLHCGLAPRLKYTLSLAVVIKPHIIWPRGKMRASSRYVADLLLNKW